MTREERLKFCSVCTNRSFNPKVGIVCGISGEAATFEGSCPDYNEDEREARITKEWKEDLQEDTKKEINKGRNALFVITALYTVVGFIEAFVIDGHMLLFGIVDWVIAGIFLGLALWSYKQPFYALLSGLLFYILLLALLAVMDPSTLVQGIVWKVFVIVYLFYGIKTARDAQEKMKTETTDLLDQ